MTVPYTFGTATTSIPLSNLDANFNTPITLGNTSIYLGNTTTTIGNLTLTNATISSGTVNITNVTVTTANVTNITVTGTANIATGNVTTLTSTSITDSGLTSGRVTYAGASGLLTDSSALTYNGTALTASASSAISGVFNRLTSSGATLQIQVVGSSIGTLGSDTGGNSVFDIAAVNSMYLRATGASSTMVFSTNNTTAMTLDASGRLGIGTSPTNALDIYSAPGDAYIKTQRSDQAGYGGRFGCADSIIGGSPTRSGGVDGFNAVVFGIAGSGVARFDSSGNLLVGATTAVNSSKFLVAGVSSATSPVIQGSASAGAYLNFFNNAQTTGSIQIGQGFGSGSDNVGYLSNNSNADFVFATNGTERLRLNAVGNLGLGVTPSAWGSPFSNVMQFTKGAIACQSNSIQLMNNSYYNGTDYKYVATAGAGMYEQTGGAHVWTGAASGSAGATISFSERMRIDSSGSLLVGNTTATVNERLGVYQTTSASGIYINPSNAAYGGTAFYINTTRAASNAFDFIGCYANSVGQFRVVGDGVIYAQNTSVQSISDQRLKENIRDSSDGLAVINGLRPVRYDWKVGYGNDKKNQLGFIAQEIETVFPEAVSEWQVNKNDETVYKTVGPATLIPVLVKAIQEQQALIESLTTRLTALENK